MSKLISTKEAAKILNISLQGIHYRIKNNMLQSIKKNGKIFVNLDKEMTKEAAQQNTTELYESIITVKNEEIQLLQETIAWIKEKHLQEIQRLESSQNTINSVFEEQISLLQKAFNEMREIYKTLHITHQKNQNRRISVQDFFNKFRKHNFSNSQIKKILMEKFQSNDSRFFYDPKNKEIYIQEDDFTDIINGDY